MGDAKPSAVEHLEETVFITHAPVSGDKVLTSIGSATGIKSAKKLLDISQHTGALALNPPGDIIITAELDKGISFNDTNTMNLINRINCGGRVLCVAWSPDGKYIAAGMKSGEVLIIDPNIYQFIKEIKSHSDDVSAVSFNRTSNKIISGSGDYTAIIYSAHNLAIIKTLKGHKDWIYCSVFLHDDRVITGSADKTIRVWDVEGNVVNIIKEHSDYVRSLAVSSDGMLLVSGGRDNNLCIYSINTSQLIASVTCAGYVSSLCFLDNNIILAGIHKSEIISVDAQTGKVIKKYDGKFAYPSIAIRAKAKTMVCMHVCTLSMTHSLAVVSLLSTCRPTCSSRATTSSSHPATPRPPTSRIHYSTFTPRPHPRHRSLDPNMHSAQMDAMLLRSSVSSHPVQLSRRPSTSSRSASAAPNLATIPQKEVTPSPTPSLTSPVPLPTAADIASADPVLERVVVMDDDAMPKLSRKTTRAQSTVSLSSNDPIILSRGEPLDLHDTANTCTDNQPTEQHLRPRIPFQVLATPLIANLKEAFEILPQRPVSVLNNERHIVSARIQRSALIIYLLSLLVNAFRYAFLGNGE